MTLRVVQWNTGVVGSVGVRAIQAHPGLQLVGCHAWSPEKAGQDVGLLCGIDPIGVEATADVEALLALQPDCVLYTPQFPDLDLMVRILEAGINIVSTSYFITGRKYGQDYIDRLDAAGRDPQLHSATHPPLHLLARTHVLSVADASDRRRAPPLLAGHRLAMAGQVLLRDPCRRGAVVVAFARDRRHV